MAKYRVGVLFDIEIELDEKKFDEAFMAEFRESFYRFYEITDHVEHLAQLEARGLLEDFTEGYGPIKDFGIKGKTLGWDFESLHPVEPATGSQA